MKHFKIISLLSIIFAFSAAQAETKVNGEFWANFQSIMDNGEVGTNDSITPMGFDVTRARILATHSFNENWSATLGLRGETATVDLNRAFITGKDWLAEGHTMHFGLQKNAFEREYDMNHRFWIHRSAARTIASLVSTGYGLTGWANLEDYAGLNYNIMFNDMWSVELSINNGPTEEVSNGGAGGTSHDVTGYGLLVSGKLNDNFSLMLGYDMSGTGSTGTSDAAANETVDGLTALRATIDYKSDMIDAGFEYVSFDHSEATSGGTDLETLGAMALHVDYKYAEGSSVYAWYMMTDGFDDVNGATAGDQLVDNGLESMYKIGHVWTLDQNINTGLFYEVKTRDVAAGADDSDESGLYWKWAANF